MLKNLTQSVAILNQAIYEHRVSEPLVGSVVPGQRKDFVVTAIHNYLDFSDAVRSHTATQFDPIRKMPEKLSQFPAMGDSHSKNSAMMKKLQDLIKQHKEKQQVRSYLDPKNQPIMHEGYERIQEDLSWRSQGNLV